MNNCFNLGKTIDGKFKLFYSDRLFIMKTKHWVKGRIRGKIGNKMSKMWNFTETFLSMYLFEKVEII